MMKQNMLAILLLGYLWVNAEAKPDNVYTRARGLEWVSTTGNKILSGAVEGGYRHNFAPLYVARVLAPDGKYRPAKACTACSNGALYNWDNIETPSYKYDLLVEAEPGTGTFHWVPFGGYRQFNAAVLGGEDANGEELLICQAYNPDHAEYVCGEYNEKDDVCTIVTAGSAYKYTSTQYINKVQILNYASVWV